MRNIIIIIKSLIFVAACLQIAMAQNAEKRNMNQDSTNLVPSGMTTAPTNQTFTSTYSTVMGACGADNGKTLSSAPKNLCNTGTPSTVYTNGNSFAWSCTGNYGTASAVSCGATQAAPRPTGAECITAGSHNYLNIGASSIIYTRADGSTYRDYGWSHPMANQPVCVCGSCGWFWAPTDGWLQTFTSLVNSYGTGN